MALDEALLLAAEQAGIATLRFYAWREPTLSLGYFQSHAGRAGHAASASCPLIRRASGGGAILHDQELTYSIVLPHWHELANRAEHLYLAAHETLIETLAELGIKAALCELKSDPRKSSTTEPFLCFERRAWGDVLIGNYKVAGSAQRRHRGAVLQHGSVLLARSQFSPELPGIADLTAEQLSFDRLQKLWQLCLANRLAVRLEESPPTAATIAAAEEIAWSKFASPQWTARR